MKQYIDKDALVTKIKHHLQFTPEHTNAFIEGEEHAYRTILSFLDTLELKESDLEKEIEEVKHNYKVDDNRHTSICSADIEWLANHFFELGLKVQKGDKL